MIHPFLKNDLISQKITMQYPTKGGITYHYQKAFSKAEVKIKKVDEYVLSINEREIFKGLTQILNPLTMEYQKITIGSPTSFLSQIYAGQYFDPHGKFFDKISEIHRPAILKKKKQKFEIGEYRKRTVLKHDIFYWDNIKKSRKGIFFDFGIEFINLTIILIEALGYIEFEYMISKNLDAQYLLDRGFPIIYVSDIWTGLKCDSRTFQSYFRNSKEQSWAIIGDSIPLLSHLQFRMLFQFIHMLALHNSIQNFDFEKIIRMLSNPKIDKDFPIEISSCKALYYKITKKHFTPNSELKEFFICIQESFGIKGDGTITFRMSRWWKNFRSIASSLFRNYRQNLRQSFSA